MTGVAEEEKINLSQKTQTENFNEMSVTFESLHQEIATETVQDDAITSSTKNVQTADKPAGTVDVDRKEIETVSSTEITETTSKETAKAPGIPDSVEASPALPYKNETDFEDVQALEKILTENVSPSGLQGFLAHPTEAIRSSNATLSSLITTQTNRSESHQRVEKDETSFLKASNSTKKILAVRFDSKGDSIGLDGDESDSKENEISNEEKASKHKVEKDNLIHDHDHVGDDDQTDPENEASDDRDEGSENESDESDGIPIITIPLGDILRKYMTILPPDNSRYEYDYEDSKEEFVKEFNDKLNNNIKVVQNSDSKEL